VTTDQDKPAAAAVGGLREPGWDDTGLLTDHYELTMLRGALHSGVAHRRAVFEVFARYLPHGRRYGVMAGVGRLLDALADFRFGPAQLDFLQLAGITDEPTLRFLESYRFGGDIWGYAEGDCYFPGSPILVVEGTFAEAVVLETLALSVLNHDCAIAAAGSRMVHAAAGRPLIEMGSRRTHERAAVASARAAYIAGFASTSNLRAGFEYQIPTSGTSAHAFTLLHDSEREAFKAQVNVLGAGTTLLVDTYDVAAAVGVRPPGARAARLARRAAHQDRAHRRPGRALDRRAGRGPGRRLRGGHLAGHRLGRADGRAGLQARRQGPRQRRRRAAAGRQALGRQAVQGRP
jgi:putative nicotinate phosphoribosyltransferase